ncbi:MAG: ribosome biogenesis GTPase Der, partial [Myxococcales bacterium]|nr:ribosome biogenesis GTPase Der [Myxococcales bacterium]
LCRSRKAIVEDVPGVTRDRNYADAVWDDKHFTIVDTGGFDPGAEDKILELMREQAQLAIDEADVIILLFDGRAGLMPADEEVVAYLRRAEKPIFYVVNKIDGREQDGLSAEFYALGVETIYPISSAHGHGISDLFDDVAELLPDGVDTRDETDDSIRVAVVGKPNAGKSTFINKLLGEERLLTSDLPGTTRDSIDTELTYNGRRYVFVDTAGIRRKRSISQRLEKFSVIKAISSLEEADIVLILVDATIGATEQDEKIAGLAFERGRGCLLLINKWDLVEKDTSTAGTFAKELRDRFKFLSFAPIHFLSAKTGLRVAKTLQLIERVHEQYTRRIGTGELNRFFEEVVERKQPAMYRTKKVKIYYVTQVTTKPPTFVAKTNFPEAIHFSYERFLKNQLRERFGFEGTPIRLYFRPRGGKRTEVDD